MGTSIWRRASENGEDGAPDRGQRRLGRALAEVVGPNPGPTWKAVGTGDFNGDGLSDILWQNTNGQAAIWEMNGTTPIAMAAVGPNPGPSWKVAGTGDYNNDGHSDILWQNASGQAAIWEMNGTTPIGMAVVGPNPGPSWHT
jgi:hypothetical protein